MTIKWDKVGAIVGVASFFVAGCAIVVQLVTPEIRCRLGLDRSGCTQADQSSSSVTTKPSIITQLPSPSKDKPDVAVKSPTPSPQVVAEEKFQGDVFLREKLIGKWISSDICELDTGLVTGLVKVNRVIVFHKDGKAGETTVQRMTNSRSRYTLPSPEISEARIDISITYEWNVEGGILHIELIGGSGSLGNFSANGKPLDGDKLKKMRDNIRKSVDKNILEDRSVKYKVLNIEENSMILESIDKVPTFSCNSTIKFGKLESSS